jgi:TetR/AcrR family transcriptional regulator, regulator of biofilm formation and stress response
MSISEPRRSREEITQCLAEATRDAHVRILGVHAHASRHTTDLQFWQTYARHIGASVGGGLAYIQFMQSSKSNAQLDQPAPTERREHPMRARSAARRALLLDSIIELIEQEGVDAVTHRRVAAHARVPLGSTTYYFESRERMLVEALQRFERQEIEALRQRLDELSTRPCSRRRIVQMLVDIIQVQLDEDRRRTVAQYTLMCEAARRPELAPIVREWTAAWCAFVEKLLATVGVSNPSLEAAMLVAMLDGFLLQQLAGPTDDFLTATLEPAISAAIARAQRTQARSRKATAAVG